MWQIRKKITNSQLSRLTNISLFLFFSHKTTRKKRNKNNSLSLVRPLERLIMLTGKPSYHNYNWWCWTEKKCCEQKKTVTKYFPYFAMYMFVCLFELWERKRKKSQSQNNNKTSRIHLNRDCIQSRNRWLLEKNTWIFSVHFV